MKLNSQNNRYIRFAQSALALCLLVGVGCAQEIGDINRINPTMLIRTSSMASGIKERSWLINNTHLLIHSLGMKEI